MHALNTISNKTDTKHFWMLSTRCISSKMEKKHHNFSKHSFALPAQYSNAQCTASQPECRQATVKDNENRSHGDGNESIYVYKLSMHSAVICLWYFENSLWEGRRKKNGRKTTMEIKTKMFTVVRNFFQFFWKSSSEHRHFWLPTTDTTFTIYRIPFRFTRIYKEHTQCTHNKYSNSNMWKDTSIPYDLLRYNVSIWFLLLLFSLHFLSMWSVRVWN